MACIVILWNAQKSVNHHLECGDDFFLNRDAQEQSLRSPITSIISGITELKAAPSWGPLFCDLLSNFFLLEYESLWR